MSTPEFPSFDAFARKVGVKAPDDYIPICPSCLEGDHSEHDVEADGKCCNFAEDEVPGFETVFFFCRCGVTSNG